MKEFFCLITATIICNVYLCIGDAPYSNHKLTKKPLKPTYQRRAETEMRNALEKAKQEDRESFLMTREKKDKQSQLIRISEAMGQTRKPYHRDVEVSEKKEQRHEGNEKANLDMCTAQKDRITELKTKLNWLQAKQQGKLDRINSKKGKKLNFEQKIKLKSLKHSSNRLETQILHTQGEISRREATIKNLRALREKCMTKLNTVEENPTSTDFELANIPITRCWEVENNSTQEGEVPVAAKRPLTHRVAK